MIYGPVKHVVPYPSRLLSCHQMDLTVVCGNDKVSIFCRVGESHRLFKNGVSLKIVYFEYTGKAKGQQLSIGMGEARYLSVYAVHRFINVSFRSQYFPHMPFVFSNSLCFSGWIGSVSFSFQESK